MFDRLTSFVGLGVRVFVGLEVRILVGLKRVRYESIPSETIIVSSVPRLQFYCSLCMGEQSGNRSIEK